jgi:hypothetical protein
MFSFFKRSNGFPQLSFVQEVFWETMSAEHCKSGIRGMSEITHLPVVKQIKQWILV